MKKVLLALVVASIFSACSPRLYRHRTIRVSVIPSKATKNQSEFRVAPKDVFSEVLRPWITPKFAPELMKFQPYRIDSIEITMACIARHTIQLEVDRTKTQLTKGKQIIQRICAPLSKKLAQKHIRFKPDAHKGGNGDLILGLLILLILGVLLVLLLNVLFFHLTMAELWGKIANVLIFTAILVLIIMMVGTCN